METCTLCAALAKKSPATKPHEFLVGIAEKRVFRGSQPAGFAEQDYQCQRCHTTLTHSTNKNDFGWTLWRG